MQEHLDHRCFGGTGGSSIHSHSFGLIRWFAFLSVSHHCQPKAGWNSSISAVHSTLSGKVGTGGCNAAPGQFFLVS